MLAHINEFIFLVFKFLDVRQVITWTATATFSLLVITCLLPLPHTCFPTDIPNPWDEHPGDRTSHLSGTTPLEIQLLSCVCTGEGETHRSVLWKLSREPLSHLRRHALPPVPEWLFVSQKSRCTIVSCMGLTHGKLERKEKGGRNQQMPGPVWRTGCGGNSKC